MSKLPTITVANVVDGYIDHREATRLVCERSVDVYRALAVHLRKALGNIEASKLTRPMVEVAYSQMSLSAGTLTVMHRLLSAAFNGAVDVGLLQRNPVRGARIPRRTSPVAPRNVDGTAFRRLLNEARKDPRNGPLVLLALATGMRRAELAGLRWEDWDPVAGTLRVGKSKTKAGVRLVAIDPSHLPQPVQTTGWIFPGRGGSRQRDDALSRRAQRVLTRAGVSGTLHTLRHTHASILLAEGVPLPAVARRLGHASPATTLRIYAHSTAASDAAATKAIGSALS
jgi:integrase